ncbi:hypothetical protein A5893_09480 [Pedobacter psychrophilus]|uniref:Glycosyl hydrolases family 2 sugar binding domain-containing protein n=1 Tax=Pedobacter psychrophilus TaxID=1826909 RepID=A0A179DFR3_9SPHI|nr:hypothetical protein [Pedobacter psychrophilus]OAQ39798.1 hypothetical protein A5893_09480 [Pedobacter psychrophilus]
MKIKINILFILLLSTSTVFAQLPLNGNWNYTFKDDKASSASNFDDSAWQKRASDNLKWGKTELPKPSYVVWIRKTVVIPSSLKNEQKKTGALALYLGRISEEDNAYFNGKKIGESTSGDIKRAYILNDKDILWDKENTFAIRITHWGTWASVNDNPIIASAKPEQIFVMKATAEGATTKDEVKNKSVTYTNTIKNNSLNTVEASITSDFFDINQKKIKSVQKLVSLKPGDNIFKIPYTSPSSFLKIQYWFQVPKCI